MFAKCANVLRPKKVRQKVDIDIKSGEFYPDLNFVDAGFKMLLKSYKQKTLTKGVKTKISKICTVFLL
jgi:hypothetical protein